MSSTPCRLWMVLLLLIVSAPVAFASPIPLSPIACGDPTTPVLGACEVTTTIGTIWPFPQEVSFNGFGIGQSMNLVIRLWEWDGNGQGLGLDLSSYDGISLFRGGYDGGSGITFRLFTSPTDYLFLFTGTTWFSTVFGDVPLYGNYYLTDSGSTGLLPFTMFTRVGTPDLTQINTVQVEARSGGSGGGFTRDVQFANLPVPVPDAAQTGLLLAIGLGGLLVARLLVL